jgi:phosphatidylinositol-4,5-bisphosphate 3-kinase catalytic subunit alpha/beta/delta
LVTGADEVIKNVLKEIFKSSKGKIKIKPKSANNKFILQVEGYKEYLIGNLPLLNYERVRLNLRGHEHECNIDGNSN